MNFIDDEKKLRPFFDTHLVDELAAAEDAGHREERKRRSEEGQ